MRNLDKAFAWLASDALSRRVRRDQLRLLGLELLQLIHQPVEFRVADLRIVEHVIAVLVMANLVAKRFNAGCRFVTHTGKNVSKFRRFQSFPSSREAALKL